MNFQNFLWRAHFLLTSWRNVGKMFSRNFRVTKLNKKKVQLNRRFSNSISKIQINSIIPVKKVKYFQNSFSVNEKQQSIIESSQENNDVLSEIEPIKDELNIFITTNQYLLEYVHNIMGVPWWATIVISTIILRSIFTLPISIWQQKNVARLLNVQPKITESFEQLKHQVARRMRSQGRSYEEFQAELQKKFDIKIKQIHREIKWHPAKNFMLPWFQIPLFICMSITLHYIEDENDFRNGGILWFTDLTAVDPTWFFPVAVGATNLLNVEIHKSKKNSIAKKIITNVFRGLSILMIPVAIKTPLVENMASLIKNIHLQKVFTNVVRQETRLFSSLQSPELKTQYLRARGQKLNFTQKKRAYDTQVNGEGASESGSENALLASPIKEQPPASTGFEPMVDFPTNNLKDDIKPDHQSHQTTEIATRISAELDWSKSTFGLSSQAFPKEVCDTLLSPINHEDIECKPDGLLYLPEIKYRRILNRAFGPGGWGLAPRGEAAVNAKNISREYCLVIARGEQDYFDATGLPTAAEGAKSNALMRCCKDLGIASELWDPVFIREFKKRYCEEVNVEYIPQKKRKKIWKKKDIEIDYPYRLMTY
ncbi:8285_t:CDS:10 [Diversispora eburnea]|uniref:Mitochondrial genome maintenance protein MGM101 n=1 Tax=Diversispora eburnea TaxID=1213867 RepID=A0A9N9FZ24_9GLOM|nr:8285_t:CDS:10 [Diversispora eburnea]